MSKTATAPLSSPARVLIVAQEPASVAPLTQEIMRRSALVAVASTVAEAGAAVRTNGFEVIFIAAREADAETALLIQLLRGASQVAPRVLFLAHPDHIANHPLAVASADAAVSWALPSAEIADLAVPSPEADAPRAKTRSIKSAPKAAAVPVPVETAESKDEIAAEKPESATVAATADAKLLPAAETIARAAEAIARAAESIASFRPPVEVVPVAERIVPTPAAAIAPAEITAPAAPAAAPLATPVPEPVAETMPRQTAAVITPEPVVVAAPAPIPAPVTSVEPSASIEPLPVATPAPAPVAPPVLEVLPLRVDPPAAPAPVAAPTPAPAPAAPPIAETLKLEVPKPHVATVARLPQRTVNMPEPAKAAPAPAPAAEGEVKHNRRMYDRKDEGPKHSRASRIFFATGWFALAAAIIGLTTWPISTAAQFTLGLAVIAAMTVIRKLRLGGIWRPTFLALGITMILRYIYWRTTSTLPPMHDWVNFTPGFILYLAEMYCVMMFFISMFIIADPIERKPPPQLPDDRVPSVDVYIPTYNEDSALLSATIAAVTQMDYPKDKLNVYLLDDGGTDQKCNQSDPDKAAEAIARRAELQSLCLEMGITYITRARNEHAKAGNMNNALSQTSGQIIVVFDADHAPARQFLRETVGYFAMDKKLFLVQTPHFFINPDPVEKNLKTFDRMPSENEMFYGTIQKGLDKWNGAFFCGSAALISRRALESVGGFSGISITEDCETALDLHKRGWNSLYVDKPLIAGLQPESLVSFIGQRSRWCRGMVQILVLKNPLLARNISMKQRICYVSSMFYWLFPIPRMIFLLSPFLYIFFSMQIFQANAQEFFAYVSIYMLTHMTIQNYLHGQTRWPWISEAYEYVQTIYLVKGIWGVLLNPRKPTFNVTAKGLTLDNDHLSELAWPYFAAFGAILFSLVVACWRFLAENEMNELLLIVGGWSFYNLMIAGVALGIVAERRERRKTPRLIIDRKGELMANGITVPVRISDASTGGMRIRADGPRLPEGFARNTHCTLRVISERPDFVTEPIPCFIQNVANDGKSAIYGLQFENLRPSHFRGIADAMYSDMAVFENFRSSRRAIKGITMGTLQFFWWSINHTIRAFYYAIALRGNKAPVAVDGEQMAEPAVPTVTAQAAQYAAPAVPAPQQEAIMVRPMATAH